MSEYDIYSFGHGTATQEEIISHLKIHGIELLVDVRSFPGSKHNPHVGRDRMQYWIPEAGIEYRWMPELGGFRPHNDECDHDIIWRNKSFRNYAGYTRSAEFIAGMKQLKEAGSKKKTAFMCSESVWWRCHRRIMSDFFTVACGMKVGHIMHDHKIYPHIPTEGVRLRPKHNDIIYDGRRTELFPEDDCDD